MVSGWLSMEEGDGQHPERLKSSSGILLYWVTSGFVIGKASAQYMLPDCFGFPSSLPTILAHSGAEGSFHDKLVWGSSAPGGGPESREKLRKAHPSSSMSEPTGSDPMARASSLA